MGNLLSAVGREGLSFFIYKVEIGLCLLRFFLDPVFSYEDKDKWSEVAG